MLQEHQLIIRALEKLIGAAQSGQKPEYEIFANKLKLHTPIEEEVLYPAAVLIGEYLKKILN